MANSVKVSRGDLALTGDLDLDRYTDSGRRSAARTRRIMLTAILAGTTILALAAAIFLFVRERKSRTDLSKNE
jgi:hypothetical protein